MHRGIAAVVKGLLGFDPSFNISGIIFNKIENSNHKERLKDAILAAGLDVNVFGGIPNIRAFTQHQFRNACIPFDPQAIANILILMRSILNEYIATADILSMVEIGQVRTTSDDDRRDSMSSLHSNSIAKPPVESKLKSDVLDMNFLSTTVITDIEAQSIQTGGDNAIGNQGEASYLTNSNKENLHEKDTQRKTFASVVMNGLDQDSHKRMKEKQTRNTAQLSNVNGQIPSTMCAERSPDDHNDICRKSSLDSSASTVVEDTTAEDYSVLQERVEEENSNHVASGAVRIAVAKDDAFCLYYRDNLRLLETAGAELVFFSPLSESLPEKISGVFLGGGFPEYFAQELANNKKLKAELILFAGAGGVIYAECGGLLFLSQSLQPWNGIPQSMVGLFPFKAILPVDKPKMGYVEVEVTAQNPLFPAGWTLRGYVHHASELVEEYHVAGIRSSRDASCGSIGKGCLASNSPSNLVNTEFLLPIYKSEWGTGFSCNFLDQDGEVSLVDGFCRAHVLASFVHINFGSCVELATAIVERCKQVDSSVIKDALSGARHLADSLTGAIGSIVPFADLGEMICSRDFHPQSQCTHKSASRSLFASDLCRPIPMVRSSPDLKIGSDHAKSGVKHGMVHNSGFDCQVMHLPESTTLEHIQGNMQNNGFNLSSNARRSHYRSMSMHNMDRSSMQSGSPLQFSPRSFYSVLEQEPHFTRNCPSVGDVNSSRIQPKLGAGLQQNIQDTFFSSGRGCCFHSMHHWDGVGSDRHTISQSVDVAGKTHFASLRPDLDSCLPLNPVETTDLYPLRFCASRESSVIGMTDPDYPSDDFLSEVPRISTDSSYVQVTHIPTRTLPPMIRCTLSGQSDKIITLGPGVTEIAWALGLGNRVVAVADDCDFPLEASKKARAMKYVPFCTKKGMVSASAPVSSTSSRSASPRKSSVDNFLAARLMANAAFSVIRRHNHSRSLSKSSSSFLLDCSEPGQENSLCAVREDIQIDDQVIARERPGLIIYEEEIDNSSKVSAIPKNSNFGARNQCGPSCDIMQSNNSLEKVYDDNLIEFPRIKAQLCNKIASLGFQKTCSVLELGRSTLSDVLDGIIDFGEAAGVADEAHRLVERLRARLRRVAGEAAAAIHSDAASSLSLARTSATCNFNGREKGRAPKVLVLSSIQPFRAEGLWVPDMVSLAGGESVPVQTGEKAKMLDWNEIVRIGPEVIVVAGLKDGNGPKVFIDLCLAAGLPGWWLLPAVRSGMVFVCEAALLLRSGPRLVDGTEALARMIHGDAVAMCCPPRAVLKLSLRPGQRCRPRLLPNYFMAFT